MPNYEEAAFVLYALAEMNIPVRAHQDRHIYLENGFTIEVENRDLYRLSADGFVISPFDDVGKLCQFIQRNQANEND